MRKLFVFAAAALTLLAISSPAAASSTTCNGTFTGATFTDDIVVPEDGSCTIIDSTVGDDVLVGKNAYFESKNSQIGDDVEANNSLTIFIDAGTTVGGRVEANRTAKVFIFNSTIDGRIEIWRTTEKVNICGNQVGGRVQVQKSGTDILIGDPQAIGCAGNTVADGDVKVHGNFTDVEFVIRGNTVKEGGMEVFNNRGPVEKFVQDNVGDDELDCFGNEEPFTSSGNTGFEEQEGQCAVPDTECNETLTAAIIPGDLVVPENGSCTIIGSTVGDDVKVGRNAYFESSNSKIGDEVRASSSLTIFIHDGSTVGGDVKANETFQVFLFDSTLEGDVNVFRSEDQVNVCGNQIDGDARIAESGRDILFGDPQTIGCAGNTVLNEHNVRIVRNNTDVELVVRGNEIQGGDMHVLDNRGPAEKFVQDNTGGDELVCQGNQQPFTASGNTGWDEQQGQCAIPPTECDTTLTGATIEGDLVVPENGSCTIIGSTVGDDVRVDRNAYFESNASTIGDDVEAWRAVTLFIHSGSTVGDDIESHGSLKVFLFDSTLNGPVHVSSTPEKVQICGNQIDGNVRVENSGTDILIGDPLAAACAGNTIKNAHSVKAVDNFTDVEFVIRGNAFEGGNLGVFDNGGPADKFVQDNTGGTALKCFGNESPFTGTPNGFTSEQGQCAEI